MKKLFMILPLVLVLCFVYGSLDKEEIARIEELKALSDVEEQPTWNDIDYVGDGIVGHRLDIYLPDSSLGPFPAIVYIYGSAFFGNNRKGTVKHAFAPVLLDAGFAVVAVNHRGTKEDNIIFPAPVHDVKAAVRFIRANAAKYNLDPSRIGATGCSSGGHLVAFLGTSGGVTTHAVGETTMDIGGSLGTHKDVSSSVQAVCDWFGPTDFLVMDTCSSPSDLHRRLPMVLFPTDTGPMSIISLLVSACSSPELLSFIVYLHLP